MNKEKRLKDLNLLDRFLFAEVTEDAEALELILEIILGKEIVLQETPQAEKEIRRTLWSKKVRLDVLSRDSEGNIYNAEAQKENTGALQKRSRFYHGMIDSKLLEVGELDYNKMDNVTIIIIIAPFDLFGDGLYKYTFQMACDEVPGRNLNDGAKRIFLNTRGTNPEGVSQALIDLLHYIEHSTEEIASCSENNLIQKLHKKVETVKQSEEVGVRFMNSWEEEAMAHQKGIIQGRKEALMETASKMKAQNIPDDVIAKCTGLTEEEILKIENN